VSTQVTTAVGKFVWHEHVSTQPAKAQEFFKQLLGWDYEVFKTGDVDYTIIQSGGKGHGGFPPVPEGTPSHWVGNVAVEGADASVEKAKSAGGSVIVDPMDIPEVGRYAVIRDPQGGVLAVFQPTDGGDGPQGQGVFVWDELGTSDVAGAESFYGDVFGWTTKDMGADYGGYKIFQRGSDDENGVGGLMANPDSSMPTAWHPYVAVDDVDATLTKTKELGGSTVLEPMDVPEVGRIAVIQDTTGAVLGLIKPQPQS
jgi:predicted enzyme related to lactoylglutathione lyase